jgi:hypothetical protein
LAKQGDGLAAEQRIRGYFGRAVTGHVVERGGRNAVANRDGHGFSFARDGRCPVIGILAVLKC